ncbi:hypothetical protein CCL14_14675 [Pseudomonas syringae]|nr:hypothetical protein CCL12_18695 [Pseudomonas syringae]PBP33957.1 hypothetical protein CCL12_12015 [Pseudomonas syringae]PBP39726.1 hypothetical protein CCL14_14675 [Pseudomonas syringae]
MFIVPMLRVGMQFVTLCVTQRSFFVRWIDGRLRSPFLPSATCFDGPKQAKHAAPFPARRRRVPSP